MRAYVINLARSFDRRAHITAELEKAGLEYEIITAVDGQDLDLGDRFEQMDTGLGGRLPQG